MIEPLLFLLLGLVGLWFGSNLLVSGAKGLARRIGLSEAVIGLSIIAIGTSLPEIFTNVQSGLHVLAGIPAAGIAMGTVLGSTLSTLTLVLGICALFAKRLVISQLSLYRDGLIVLLAHGALFLAAIDGKVSAVEGIALIALFVIYATFLLLEVPLFASRRGRDHWHITLDALLVAVGCGIVWVGAQWVVDNGVALARLFGTAEQVIGVGIGLGASLPELSVSLVAIIRKAGDLSVGNLLGSGIVNSLLALGIGASIAGFSVSSFTLWVLFPFLFFGSALSVTMLFAHKGLNRLQAVGLIMFYLFFVYMVFVVF